MKRIALILIFFSWTVARCQNIPDFESNTTDRIKKQSVVFTEFENEYNVVISWTKDCYSFCNAPEQLFFILGQKNGKWSLFKWYVKFSDREKKIIKRAKKKKLRINSISVDSLLTNWTQNQFWTLNKDSLNWSEKIDSNGKITTFVITDGCSDKFEIFTKDKHLINSSYKADYFQKVVPNSQRRNFIICRNMFFEVIQKNNISH